MKDKKSLIPKHNFFLCSKLSWGTLLSNVTFFTFYYRTSKLLMDVYKKNTLIAFLPVPIQPFWVDSQLKYSMKHLVFSGCVKRFCKLKHVIVCTFKIFNGYSCRFITLNSIDVILIYGYVRNFKLFSPSNFIYLNFFKDLFLFWSACKFAGNLLTYIKNYFKFTSSYVWVFLCTSLQK